MTVNDDKEHTVLLTSTNGGRHTLTLSKGTTLKELSETACKLLGGCSGVELSTGFPPQKLPPNDALLARSVIPHRSRVQVISINNNNSVHLSKKRGREKEDTTPEESASRKRSEDEKSREHSSASDEGIVDLTGDDSGEENDLTKVDEALARRLQQEENEAALGVVRDSAPRCEQASSRVKSSALSDSRDPTTVTDDYWVWQDGAQPYLCEQAIYGKWLIFYPEALTFEKWQMIAKAVASGELHSAKCKVATRLSAMTKGTNRTFVVCVYSTQERMDEVGLRLIELTRSNSLHYKTNQATEEGHYSSSMGGSHDGVAARSLYWNKGRPGFTKISGNKMKPAQSRSLANAAAQVDAPLNHTYDDRVVTVVGLKYHKGVALCSLQEGKTKVRLCREANNAYDSSAIRIEIDGKKLGYVENKKGKEADLLSPWLDHDLVYIESATIKHIMGESTVTVQLTGRACNEAKSMLACL